tara:strand:+ start:801 stop:974 length:174 start_codon:yes stop_codon:yes gene_type:complete
VSVSRQTAQKAKPGSGGKKLPQEEDLQTPELDIEINGLRPPRKKYFCFVFDGAGGRI